MRSQTYARTKATEQQPRSEATTTTPSMTDQISRTPFDRLPDKRKEQNPVDTADAVYISIEPENTHKPKNRYNKSAANAQSTYAKQPNGTISSVPFGHSSKKTANMPNKELTPSNSSRKMSISVNCLMPPDQKSKMNKVLTDIDLSIDEEAPMSTKSSEATIEGIQFSSPRFIEPDATLPRQTFGDMPNVRDSNCYFKSDRKPIRVVDFVLAFESSLGNPSKKALQKEMNHRKYRQIFEDKLEELGLQIERDNQDGLVFVKIHATWEFLIRQADLMQFNVPLAAIGRDEEVRKPDSWTEWAIKKCFNGNNPLRLSKSVVRNRTPYYATRFDSRRLDMFPIASHQTFFKSQQRIRLVVDTILRTTISTKKYGTCSYFWLRNKGVYTAGFPLHDSDYDYPADDDPFKKVPHKQLPMRRWLYMFWGNFRCIAKFQPLDAINEYFGLRVALYFAWLGFYTKLLWLPAIVGLICFLYGMISLSFDLVTNAMCYGEQANWVTCRECLHRSCPYKILGDSCAYAKLSHVFDNYSTLIFAFFISVWSVFFLEFWKRKQAQLTAHWHANEQEVQEQMLRPEYQLNVKTTRRNPVTRENEPYLKWEDQRRRILASLATVTIFVLLLLGLLIGMVMYRLLTVGVFQQVIQRRKLQGIVSPSLLTSITTSFINAVIISIMSMTYKKAARKLTEFEFPKTDQAYELSYTYKMFAFEFMNYYGSVFYLALFKGKFSGSMENVSYLTDQCPISGCMGQTCIQLIIILSGKQIFNNIVEFTVPTIVNFLNRRKHRKAFASQDRTQRDYLLQQIEKPIMFDDYLEMVIQYGFLVMFAAAFPLAALFSLLNNILEIRIDANKLLTELRRPIPERKPTIGPWLPILEMLTRLAVVTNAFVIAFTSDAIDRLYLGYEYGTVDAAQFGHFYVDHILSIFNTSNYNVPAEKLAGLQYDQLEDENVTVCRYRGYYSPPNATQPYARTIEHHQVLIAKMAFVIIFQNAVTLIQNLIQYTVADVPDYVNQRIERQKHVAKQAYLKYELGANKYKKIYHDTNDEQLEESKHDPSSAEVTSHAPLQAQPSTPQQSSGLLNFLHLSSMRPRANTFNVQLPIRRPRVNTNTSRLSTSQEKKSTTYTKTPLSASASEEVSTSVPREIQTSTTSKDKRNDAGKDVSIQPEFSSPAQPRRRHAYFDVVKKLRLFC